MEWQVADATDEQMTVNIFTQFILPDPEFYPEEQNQFNHRITATVVLTLSRTQQIPTTPGNSTSSTTRPLGSRTCSENPRSTAQ